MNFVLVTGNGFDIEHKIPSSYKNFLNFIENFITFYKYREKDLLYRRENEDRFRQGIFAISSQYKDVLAIINGHEDTDKNVLKEFYECVYSNVWISYFQECLKQRESYGKEYNWVDIEEEIATVIRMITDHRNTYGNVELRATEMTMLKSEDREQQAKLLISIMQSMKTHGLSQNHNSKSTINPSPQLEKQIENQKNWIRIKQIFLDDYKKLLRALEIYLDFIVDSSKIEEKDIFKRLTFDRIITFNYTNTYNRLYQEVTTDFVHGSADYKRSANENNIVVGIDEFLPDDQKNKDIEFIDYRKYYQRIIKKCDFTYREFLENNGEVITWFFGHSMAATDRDILAHMLPSTDNKIRKSYICYHSEDAFRQQVTNLVQILGQDQLNELVCGMNPRIIFISQENIVDEMKKCTKDKK